jgi:hypothetical protein
LLLKLETGEADVGMVFFCETPPICIWTT